MRDFLNGILAFIGAASLTDDEFDALLIVSAAYNMATYEALTGVLNSREAISTYHDKLGYFFRARGVEITVAARGKSNIFLGSEL